jgi:WD40 repeat protein/predicted Ser/Thr protein kinase
MHADRFQRLIDLFQEACELPADALPAFLDARCGGDAALRTQLMAMLSADRHGLGPVQGDGAGMQVLAKSLAGRSATGSRGGGAGEGSAGGSESAGRAGGAGGAGGELVRPSPAFRGVYEVLGLVGEGGMGEVYRALQASPRRVVALKMVRRGASGVSVLRRFNQEAQALARLQHPGIAQIFEAGMDESGQAFIAMEFVQGPTLVEFARQRGLDHAAKLALLARVCDAVAHAHQRAVIHRDLKPANILVNEDGQPKILDFGVARIADDPANNPTTMHTMSGQLLGTLAYMSPEQVRGLHDRVDARSDVYALGVLLFELLSGELPFPVAGLGIAEAVRMIADEEPRRLASLDRAFRGDVDVIVATATAKDPDRRYQSADALAADIRRLLAGDPIQARQDSAVYVMRRRLRRYQTAAAFACLIVIALVMFGVMAIRQTQRESDARQQALDLLKSAEIERARADANATRYQRALHQATVEQGRLLGSSGGFANAESLLWQSHVQDPSDLTRFALRELYSRTPCLASFFAHNGMARSVDVSPDGTLALTSGDDGFVRLWRTSDWSCVCAMWGHRETVEVARFSPEGKYVVSAALDGTLCVWDVASGALVRGFELASPVRTLAISPDLSVRRVALGSTDGYLRLADLLSEAEDPFVPLDDAQFTGRPVNAVVFSPDGRTLASGDIGGMIRTWSVEPLRAVSALQAHRDMVSSLAFAPDGRAFMSGGRDRTARFWKLAGPDQPPTPDGSRDWNNGNVRAARYSPDGRELLLTGYWRVERWDADRRAPLPDAEPMTTSCADAAFAPGGDWIMTAGTNGYIRVWQLTPRPDFRRVPAHEGRVFQPAVHPGGKLAATIGLDGAVRLWNLPGLTSAGTLGRHPGPGRRVAFDPVAPRLASAGSDGIVRVWDLERPGEFATIKVSRGEAFGLDFSPDGRTIVHAVRDGAVSVYDSYTGVRLASADSGNQETTDACFSADGRSIIATHRWLVSVLNAPGYDIARQLEVPGSWSGIELPDRRLVCGGWEGRIDVFPPGGSLASGRSLSGHAGVVYQMAAAPILEGGRVAVVSASADTTIKIWDPDSGWCLQTLEPQCGQVTGLAVVPGTKALLSTHADGSVGLWDLSYFDRHVASNQTAMLRQLRETPEPARAASMPQPIRP